MAERKRVQRMDVVGGIYEAELDESGNEVHRIYEDGLETWHEYDDKGHVVHASDNRGREVWRKYDEQGNEVSYRDSDGNSYGQKEEVQKETASLPYGYADAKIDFNFALRQNPEEKKGLFIEKDVLDTEESQRNFNSLSGDVLGALKDDLRDMYLKSGVKGKFENSYYHDVYQKISSIGFEGQESSKAVAEVLGDFWQNESGHILNGRDKAMKNAPHFILEFSDFVYSDYRNHEKFNLEMDKKFDCVRDELQARRSESSVLRSDFKNDTFFRFAESRDKKVPYIDNDISLKLSEVEQALKDKGINITRNRNFYRTVVDEVRQSVMENGAVTVSGLVEKRAKEMGKMSQRSMESLVGNFTAVKNGSLDGKDKVAKKASSVSVYSGKEARSAIFASIKNLQTQGVSFKDAVEKTRENAAQFISKTGRSIAYTRREINRVTGFARKSAREKMEGFVKSIDAVKNGAIGKASRAMNMASYTAISVTGAAVITADKVKSAIRNAGANISAEIKKAIDTEKNLHYMAVRERILEKERKEEERHAKRMEKLDAKYNDTLKKSSGFSKEEGLSDLEKKHGGVRNPDGSISFYDKNGFKWRDEFPGGERVEYQDDGQIRSYDSHGKMTYYNDGNGNETSWVNEYDSEGRLLSSQSGEYKEYYEDGRLSRIHDVDHDTFFDKDGNQTTVENRDVPLQEEKKVEVKKIETLPTLAEISTEDAASLKDSIESVCDSRNLTLAGKGRYIVNTPAVVDENGKPFTGVNNFILINDVTRGGEQKYISADGNYHFKSVSSVDEYRELAGSGKRGLYSVAGEKDKGQNFILVKDESAVAPSKKKEYILNDPDIGAEAFLGTCLFCAQSGLSLVVAEEALNGIKKSLENRFASFGGSLSEIQELSNGIEQAKDGTHLLEEPKPSLLGKDFDDALAAALKSTEPEKSKFANVGRSSHSAGNMDMGFDMGMGVAL